LRNTEFEAEIVIKESDRVLGLIRIDNNQQETEDIVITCPPQNAMEFDEKLYQEKGCGGSETALVEMARNLKKLTGRPVKVFNMRSEDYIAESGVEYISTQ
jgi:type IV secretory pathway protease TraF